MVNAPNRNGGSRGSLLRVNGGIAGIAEATTAPAGASGAQVAGRGYLNPQNPSFWVGVIYVASWGWLLWIRFVYRGATI